MDAMNRKALIATVVAGFVGSSLLWVRGQQPAFDCALHIRDRNCDHRCLVTAGVDGSRVAAYDFFPLLREETVTLRLPESNPTRNARSSFGLWFEENIGQHHAEVKFLRRGSGYDAFLTENELVLVLHPAEELAVPSGSRRDTSIAADDNTALTRAPAAAPPLERPTALRMRFMGARPGASAEGEAPLRGKSNYLIGNDPSRWRTNISNFSRVRYREFYPGVDLVYYSNDAGQLEYDLVVAPGADPNQIRLAVEGADEAALEGDGNLLLRAGGRELRWLKPKVFQLIAGQIRPIPTSYSLSKSGMGGYELGFQVAAYDPAVALVIDPALVYSTFFGPGQGADGSWSISNLKIDASGNLYAGGSGTTSTFPLKNEIQEFTGAGQNDRDWLIFKLSPELELIYATYFGGTGDDVSLDGMAIDHEGHAWFAGWTKSVDVPTKNAFQMSHNGGGQYYADVFVGKLSPEGSSLAFATYFGGSGDDIPKDLVLDEQGNGYLGGYTHSSAAQGFPVKNAIQPARLGSPDGFLAKLNPRGQLEFCTYLGGSRTDFILALAVGSDGSIVAAGETQSTDFPTKGAIQPRPGGHIDGFLTKLSGDGQTILFSTYFGGPSYDAFERVAIAPNGKIYLLGLTYGDFPVKNPIYSYSGRSDATIVCSSADGQTLEFSTYLGGSYGELRVGLEVDSASNIYVSLNTSSGDLPIVDPLEAGSEGLWRSQLDGYAWSGYVAVLPPDGSQLLFASYLGGSGNEALWAMAVDPLRNIHLAGGQWGSSDFPLKNPLDNEPRQNAVWMMKVAPFGASIPAVQIWREGDRIVLSWPISAGDFVLEAAEQLGATFTWVAIGEPPAIVGDQNVAIMETTGIAKFYRLRNR